MKVALLAPAGAMYRFNGTFKKAIHYAPLTLSTLAAYIPEDIEVVIHDETIEKIPLELDADIVVMTSITGTSERVYKYARYFKSKGKKVILGGPHPTLCPEEAIQHCDSVVIGRSEWLFTEIMEDARNNSLKKFYVQKENSLENLKLPKRELLKKERYVSINSIEATKGCSFDCSFCVGKALYPKLLKRPINEIIAEIETFKKKEEIIKSQKTFSSDVSHELKTPLAIMKGYLDILEWGKNDKDLLNEAIENLNLEVKNIERIINTLFLSSNLEKITIKKEIIDVKQLFEKIKKDYELLNIKREILVKSDGNVNIFVDKNLISEVLRGLIDNSIKYSVGNIELIAKENKMAEVIVRNYGEGIPEEEKKKIFNRNFQGKNAKKGAGLGLSIIKDIILLNDGEIYLENRENGLDVRMTFKKIEFEK